MRTCSLSATFLSVALGATLFITPLPVVPGIKAAQAQSPLDQDLVDPAIAALEMLPWRDQLHQTAPDADITPSNLRFGAEAALKRWEALQAPPSGETQKTEEAQSPYEAYFEVFRQLARLESLARASQLVGIQLNPDLEAALTGSLSKLEQAGLTAERAGKKALKTLIESDRALYAQDAIEGLKITSTLILDYLTDVEAAQLAIDLALRLAEADFVDLATNLYADFVPDFFNTLTRPGDRLALVKYAADKAPFSSDPTILGTLTELVTNAPVEEKLALARAVFDRLDADALVSQIAATTTPFTQITFQAWLHGRQLAAGVPPTNALSDLLKAADATSNYAAFEILFASQFDQQARETFFVKAIERDLANGRALRAVHKLTNLPVEILSRSWLTIALMTQLAANDYDLYVKALAEDLVDAHRRGEIRLGEAEIDQITRAIEIVADAGFHANMARALPQHTDRLARTYLRAQIRGLFNQAVDQSINDVAIDLPHGADSSLTVAAALISASDMPAYQDSHISPEDSQLLQEVAQFLWSYKDRRGALAGFISSDYEQRLRAAVALGVTNHPAFDASTSAGLMITKAIADLLADLIDPAVAQQLAAAIGQIDQGGPIAAGPNADQLLARYARYQAAHGKRVEESLITSQEDRRAAQEAWAVFHGLDEDMTDELAKEPDYLARVTAFHRLAKARAHNLDRKGWLNSAAKQAATAPVQPAFRQSQPSNETLLTIKPAVNGALDTTARPFMPNLLLGPEAVTSRIPLVSRRTFSGLTAAVAKRGETRGTRLVRYASEHFDGVVNLGVREYIYLNNKTSTPRLIYLSEGTATLSEIVSQVSLRDPSTISYEDGIVTLHVPMEISAGATLIISGLDIKELRLDTKAGAFLVNSGTLYTDRVVIASHDVEKNQPSYVADGGKTPHFRSFIVSWSDSETYASSTRFLALGYSGGRTYGLSLSSGPKDSLYKRIKPTPPTGVFVNNSLENLFYGFYTHGAEDVVLVGNELVDGVIYGLDPHDWSYNLMMAYNTAYKTQKKHGIIISREVDDSYIIGNLSFDNAGSGIMLDRLSYGTVIFANDASRNEGDGFSSMESPCALVHSNHFAGNRRTGIKIRNAWDVHLENNAVADNGAAGIEAYIDNLRTAADSKFRNFTKDPFYPIATMAAIGNEVRNNNVGVSVRGASEALFFQNKFVNQVPKYAAGDIKELALDIVSKSMTTGLRISSRCLPHIPIEKTCSLFEQGVIFSQAAQSDYHGAEAATNFCVDVANTPQANWFNPAVVE